MTVLAIIFGHELLGSERGNLEALISLNNSGTKVHLALSGLSATGGQFGEEAKRHGLETHVIPGGSQLHLPWVWKDPFYLPRQVHRLIANPIALLALARKIGANVVFTNGTLPFMFNLPYFFFSNTPLIYRMGDSPVWESRFQMFLWRNLVRRSSEIVCISKFIQSEVEKGAQKHLRKTRVIYNHPVTRQGGVNEKLSRKLISRKRELQIVYVGQITKQKGVFDLVQALLALNDDRIGAWVVGGSKHTIEQQNTLKKLIKTSTSHTKVDMVGYTPDPRPYYVAADWHIAPSIYPEALGNIVPEAKEHSTPSMVANNGGLPELVEHGSDGIILNEITSASLQATIIGLFDIQDKWKTMGAAARENLERNMSRGTFDAAWLQVVSDALEK